MAPPDIDTRTVTMLDESLSSLDAFGPDGDTRRRRILVIDTAWNAADGSVVKCAQNLNKSFEDTLGLLTNPAIKRLPQNDPRVQALETVKAQGDKPYPYDIDPTGKMTIKSEQDAMAKLKKDPADTRALTDFHHVVWSEQVRAASLTRQAKRATRDTHER